MTGFQNKRKKIKNLRKGYKHCYSLDGYFVKVEEDMNTGHSTGAMVIFNDQPVIIGGKQSSDFVTSVEYFDGVWKKSADLPRALGGHSAVVIDKVKV